MTSIRFDRFDRRLHVLSLSRLAETRGQLREAIQLLPKALAGHGVIVECLNVQATAPSFADELVKILLVDRAADRVEVRNAPLEFAQQLDRSAQAHEVDESLMIERPVVRPFRLRRLNELVANENLEELLWRLPDVHEVRWIFGLYERAGKPEGLDPVDWPKPDAKMAAMQKLLIKLRALLGVTIDLCEKQLDRPDDDRTS